MIKNKKILIIILLLTVILITIILLLASSKSAPLPSSGPIPIFQPSPSPETSQQDVLIRIDPPEDQTGSQKYSIDQEITFYFTKEIDWKTLKITVDPLVEIDTIISNPPNAITIRPSKNAIWQPNTLHKITISKELKFLDRSGLDQNIEYQIKNTYQIKNNI